MRRLYSVNQNELWEISRKSYLRVFRLLVCGILVVFSYYFIASCSSLKATGKLPSKVERAKYAKLPNYKNGKFQNLEALDLDTAKIQWASMFSEMLNRPEMLRPSREMPHMKTDLQTQYRKPTVIWFGHSSFLLKTGDANILVDPIFGGYAGPFTFMNKAFKGSNAYRAEDMPAVDVLIISHDHYDHLDYQTVKDLKDKVKMAVVPKGVGSHLVYWGMAPDKIHELSWYDSIAVSPKLSITATPARHISGRTLTWRETHWASYVIAADGYKIFYSGDSGYGRHYKEIGEQFGPFDLAMMECGQYGKNWKNNHMFPWQTARAGSELKARIIIPIHWAKFAESNHPWNEPVRLMIRSADSLGLAYSVPQIGQPYTVGSVPLQEPWWGFE